MPASKQERRGFTPGIRFSISVIFLVSALNLVALGTVLVLLVPSVSRDLRPLHRGSWETSRAAESLHGQMMVDAQRVMAGGAEIAFPAGQFGELGDITRRSLPDDFSLVQQDLKYFEEATRRWYGVGLPIPVQYRGRSTVEEPAADPVVDGVELGVEGAEAATEQVPESGVEVTGTSREVEGGEEPAAEEQVAPAELSVADTEVFRTMESSYLQLQEQLSAIVTDGLAAGPARARSLAGYLLVWISVMAALNIYLALRLRSVLTDPLVRLTKAAVAIGEGNLDTRVVAPNRNDELGTLGRAIESMRSGLRRQFMQVQGQKQRMETIFAAMSDGVVLVDRDWQLVQSNASAARLLGVRSNLTTARGVDVRTLGVPALADPLDSDLSQSPIVKIAGPKADSPPTYVRIIRRRIAALGNEAGGFVAVIHDVTQEKQMEQVKNDFFSMVTHELKTPLTAIEGYTKLLLRERPGPLSDAQKKFLETVATQTDVLKGMIQDLLDMSRIAAGRLVLNVETVTVAEMMERVVERFAPEASSKELDLVYRMPESLPAGLTMQADGPRLEQVLGNLITNAMKFTPAQGNITVSWTAAGGFLRASVADTGKGIPEDQLPRVFDKFYQVERGDTRSVGGAGLGLYICNEIIVAHGGDITVTSAVGRGSTFTIEIPIVE